MCCPRARARARGRIGGSRSPARIASGPNQFGFDYFYGCTHARNIETIIEQDRVVAHVADVENQRRMIAKAVEWLDQGDHMLGQLLDALDRKGFAGDTLVIATSDNGAAGRPYPPLRGQKTRIHEGGHRVPFVVRWPGKVEPGTVSDQTICLNDLMATCAEILGVSLPAEAGEDGVSILPAILGTAQGPFREATVHQSPPVSSRFARGRGSSSSRARARAGRRPPSTTCQRTSARPATWPASIRRSSLGSPP